jgi:hypothetical protein
MTRRTTLTFTIFSAMITIGLGAASLLIADGQASTGIGLAVAGCISEALMLRWWLKSRRRAGQPETRQSAHPIARLPVSASGTWSRRWHGSSSVPTRGGYIDMAGLGSLAVTDNRLVIRGRGEMTTTPSEATIFLARRLGQRGIEVRRPGQQSYYFWTTERDDVVAALKRAGFEVADAEVRFRSTAMKLTD